MSRGLKIVGFLIAYPVASFVAMLSLVATQAMTGRENPALLLLGYAVGWFLLFGLAGFLADAIGGSTMKASGAHCLAFGAGGGVAGGLIGILMWTHHLGGSAGAALAAFAIPFTVPWILGGLLSLRVGRSTP